MGPAAVVAAGAAAAGAGVFGLMFVTVASRIAGLVGVSSQPTSGMALVTLLGIASLFAAAGWRDAAARAAVLTVGAIVAVAATVILPGGTYTFGSPEIPAPQATLMKTIVEGLLEGALPWGLVLSGGGLAIGALLCGLLPLAFAIGVYLPLATMAAVFAGGCIRALCERGRPAAASPFSSTAAARTSPTCTAGRRTSTPQTRTS